MSSLIYLVFLVLWATESPALDLTLTSTTDYISRAGVRDFSLTCKTDSTEPGTTIKKMRILKLRSGDEWTTVVEMDYDWSIPTLMDGLDASALTGGSDDQYLWVTWPMVDTSAGGEYVCDVIGYAEDHEGMYRKSPPVYIGVDLDGTYDDLIREVDASSDLLDTCLETVADMERAFIQSEKIQGELVSTFYETWPEGTFALFKAVTGCPAHTGVMWKTTWARFNTPYTIRNKDAVSEPSHLVDPLYENKPKIPKQMNLYFCEVASDDKGDRRSWPSGSYCIMGRKNTDCPTGFKAGKLYLNTTGNGDLPTEFGGSTINPVYDYENAELGMFFCCREDASPQTHIVLPTAKPFFLSQYKGTCQQVGGMDVTPEFVAIHLEGYHKNNEIYPDYTKNQKLGQFILLLCYYEKNGEM